MQLSCAFAPGAATPDHIALAETLGYERAWVYDSPCFYHDVWATLARAADRTTTIGLATGVAVVGLRHVTVTAAALLALEGLAPGRVTFGVGAGGTAARMLGRRAARWSEVRSYAVAVRKLLRGETIDADGATVSLMHPDTIGPRPPVEIPIVFAVAGPRGEEIARECGDGVFTVRDGSGDGFDWHCRLALGTILDEGEDLTGERIVEAAGPGAALVYHQAYASGNRQLLDSLPGAGPWVEAIDALPDDRRAAELWEGHLVFVPARDRHHIPPTAMASLTFTGAPADVRERVAALGERGVTEFVYQPCGRDIPRELRAFAAALR
jgi:5,10-methylenetetrahydromethanopterin reductase